MIYAAIDNERHDFCACDSYEIGLRDTPVRSQAQPQALDRNLLHLVNPRKALLRVNKQIHAEMKLYTPPPLIAAFCDHICMIIRLRHSNQYLKECIGFIKLQQSRVEERVDGSVPPIEPWQRKLRREYQECLLAHFDQVVIKHAVDTIAESTYYETLNQTWVRVRRNFVIKVKGAKEKLWYPKRTRGPITRLRRRLERDEGRL